MEALSKVEELKKVIELKDAVIAKIKVGLMKQQGENIDPQSNIATSLFKVFQQNAESALKMQSLEASVQVKDMIIAKTEAKIEALKKAVDEKRALIFGKKASLKKF